MKLKMILLAVLFALAVSACASTNAVKISDVRNFQGGEVQRASIEKQPNLKIETVEIGDDRKKIVVNLSIEPYSTLGILKTKAISENRFTAVEGVVSDIRFGEYFPGSIGGKCWAASAEKEYFCQSVLYRLGADSFFRAAYVIDAAPEEAAKTKIIAISIKGDYAYDLSGKEFPVDRKIYEDGKLRMEFLEKNGTAAVSVPLVLDLDKIIANWNEYSAPEGILLSPLGEKEVKYIAGINPQYTFTEKIIGTGNFTLKPDPIGSAAGLALDVFRAMNAPTIGWDYNSQLPSRRNMGLIIEYVGALKHKMVESMRAENEFLRAALAEKPKTTAVAVNQKYNSIASAEKEKKAASKKKAFSNAVANIVKLGYPEKIALELAEKVSRGDFVSVEVRNGTIAKSLLLSKKGEIVSPARLRHSKGEWFSAEKYREGNFILYRIKDKTSGSEVLFRLDDYLPPINQFPLQTNDTNENSGSRGGSKIVHEPQGGLYAGGNNLVSWAGGWVKYKADAKVSESTEAGAGFLAGYTSGRSKKSSYKWTEKSIGPVLGFKTFWDDEESNPWMLEADISPQFYSLRGKTGEGYWHRQSGLKINIRSEVKTQASENWTVGGIAEGNVGLFNKFSSSWSGDSASNRGSFELGGYGIYRLSDDWEYEIYAGTFFQGWDRLWGMKVIPLELIYQKTLKFGVGFSFFPFGLSNAYKGVASAGDLFTPWGFVQLDAGPALRKAQEKENSERLIPLNQKNKEKKEEL